MIAFTVANTTPANPLHAEFYADAAIHETVELAHNHQVATNTFKLGFRSPKMAARFRPGQFLMLRLAGTDDPLIGRPLALYDIVGQPEQAAIEVVYVVQGNLTTKLAQLSRGAELEVWGPLGNGFASHTVEHLVMVAGGIGHTPFLTVAKEHLGKTGYAGGQPKEFADRVTFCYGARSDDYLAGVADFQAIGVAVKVATDDGSAGHQGLVTDLLDTMTTGASTHVMCCGPEPMMKAVAEICTRRSWPCEVSLETPMACGIGICFSCVTRVRDSAGQWDYQRTCVAGPVFDAQSIQW